MSSQHAFVLDDSVVAVFNERNKRDREEVDSDF
jgi:hypothetical protein